VFALVADVLPDDDNIAQDLGLLNIAGTLPFALAPSIAPAILLLGGGSYAVLYAAAGVCAIVGPSRSCPSAECAEVEPVASS
jgi:hypothetical protein